MTTTICWYSGTGNSLWIARLVAEGIGKAELLSVNHDRGRAEEVGGDAVGLVFPVHIWGVPGAVLDFVEGLRLPPATYLFAVAVNAGQVANTLVQLERVLAGRGLVLSSGFSVEMPSNYIPWGGPGPVERQHARYSSAREKAGGIVEAVRGRRRLPVERGRLWEHLVFTPIYKMAFPRIASMDAKFTADGKCTRCGLCRRVCPAGNITLVEGVPRWNHRCEQCFACLQWCPPQAIQYGRRTIRFERYHHPEVRLGDLLGPE